MSKRKDIISVIVGFIGTMFGCGAVILFNNFLVMSIPLIPRMFCMIAIYWVIAACAIVLMIINKDKLADYGFSKEKLPLQILLGVGIGLGMSLILTLVPHLFGLGMFVDNGTRYRYLWQFIFEFIYCIVSIGAVEEFVFRGFIFSKFKNITNKDGLALLFSSVLFGLFHIFAGNIPQLFITGLIGALWCFLRMKIKNCSTLSLIIAHGVYDAMISVWASVFLM